MPRIKMVGFAVIALSVLGVALPSIASASPKVLYLENTFTKGPVKDNTAFNFLLGNIALVPSAGRKVECRGPNEIEGPPVTNEQKTDVVEMDYTYNALEGRLLPPCESSSNAERELDTYVKLGGFPWKVHLGANGKASLEGKMHFLVEYVEDTLVPPYTQTVRECGYEGKPKLSEVLGDPLRVRFSAVMKRTNVSPKSCASKLTLAEENPAEARDSLDAEAYYPVAAYVIP